MSFAFSCAMNLPTLALELEIETTSNPTRARDGLVWAMCEPNTFVLAHMSENSE